MPNSKRKQEVIKLDLSGYSKKEIHELCQTIKEELQTAPHGKLCVVPTEVAFPKTNTAILTAKDLDSPALWYFFRMPTWCNDELWWGRKSWEAFGWWEGENPFKDIEATDDFYWGGITYLESLDYKREEKTYSEPQGKRAFFIVADLEKAVEALQNIGTIFSLKYEDGVVKLTAWNKEKPDFKACLMIKHDWKDWCRCYYENYTDFGWKLLECSYGINTPDPEFKDGKLVFGDEFSKTPEEFIYDLATLEYNPYED